MSRLAVLRANSIGDFLMAVPALEALRRAYPHAQLTLLGNDWLPGLVQGRPGPWDRVVVTPPYPGLRGQPVGSAIGADAVRFLGEHRGRYDVVLQMHGGGRTSNDVVRALAPAVSAGPCAPDAVPLDRSIAYLPHRPEVLRWLDVAALVGASGPGTTAALVPRLTVTDADVAESRRCLPLDEEEQPFLALHVGSQDERRCWPADCFVDVARRLLRDRVSHVVLVGGPGDADRSRHVATALAPRCTDLTGKLALGGTVGVLSRASVLVGNDSGPRHLAAATGTPTVGVFWVGNLLSFGPLVGDRDRAVVSFRVDCPVCGRPQLVDRCAHDVSFVADVDVDEVHREAVALLDGLRP